MSKFDWETGTTILAGALALFWLIMIMASKAPLVCN